MIFFPHLCKPLIKPMMSTAKVELSAFFVRKIHSIKTSSSDMTSDGKTRRQNVFKSRIDIRIRISGRLAF